MPSNLPPGVRDSDIPGNRPEDAAFERWHEDACQLYEGALEQWGYGACEVDDLKNALVSLGVEWALLEKAKDDYKKRSEAAWPEDAPEDLK